LGRVGLAASSPLIAAVITNVLGGWVSDKLAHRWGDLRKGRLFVSVVGFFIAGTAVIAGVLAHDLTTAILCLSLAMGGLELTVAVSWAICLDIGGEFSGSVSSVMNMLGNIGGALAAAAIGFLATHYGWTTALLVASPMCLTAALLATRIDPTRPVVPDVRAPAPAMTPAMAGRP
jgi:MFS family permease